MTNATSRVDSPISPDQDLVAPDADLLAVSAEPMELDEAFMRRLNKNVDNYRQIITTSIKLTNPSDWTELGGKPYMQSSGAEKVASPFHVSHEAPIRERMEREDAKGKYYIYTHTARFYSRLLNRSIVVTGTCSSRDQFFSMRGGEPIPQEDVDESNILKASYTNMVVSGITRLLGIRNLTWEQLAQGGIAQDKVGKVAFRKGGQGGGQSEAASSGEAVSSKQVGLIMARLASAHIDIKDLLAHLETLNLPRDVNKIPWKRMDEVLKWVADAQTKAMNQSA